MLRFDIMLMARSSENWRGISAEELLAFLRPKCKQVLTEEELGRKLAGGKPLRIKFGIDPTGAEVHLGHVVPVMILRMFAKAGHLIDLIIGDFTARIGDPSHRQTNRAALSADQIAENLRSYQAQIGRYIDPSYVTVHHNKDWLSAMPLSELFAILQQINLNEAIQREDFRSRMREQQAVSLAEVCYGVLMGIDSVHLRSDVEVGGIDQLLNFQQCRAVMRHCGVPEEAVVTTPILEGITGDGTKMSKSFGNYIAVNATREDKFGKIMSIPDHLIVPYFTCFGEVREDELSGLGEAVASDPMEAKKQLATLVAALETGNIDDGLRERDAFERKFSKKDIREEDCRSLTARRDEHLLDVLMKSGDFKSRGELRRLFEQKAVRMSLGGDEQELAPDSLAEAVTQGVVKVGKRRFYRIELS